MNKQEIFDAVTALLFEQNAQSICPQDNAVCAYRGKDGLKCAIGHLIKDEFYDSSIEGDTICEEVVQVAVSKSIGVEVEDLDIEFLADMQAIHDMYDGQWKGAFENLAAHYLLEYKK